MVIEFPIPSASLLQDVTSATLADALAQGCKSHEILGDDVFWRDKVEEVISAVSGQQNPLEILGKVYAQIHLLAEPS